MQGMFSGHWLHGSNLRQLTLGENFRFAADNPNLPAVLADGTFTGYWQNVAGGTPGNPQGAHVFTSDELVEFYRAAPPNLADTWVWQRNYLPLCDGCNAYPCECDFGIVPPTGIPGIAWTLYAMLSLAAISAGFWGVLLRTKRQK